MKTERGGFLMGVIVGLLAGLAIALAVAVYITKVPVPFINKMPQRTAEQDAAEAQRNKSWEPNAPLAGKNPAKPANAASGVLVSPPAPGVAASVTPSTPAVVRPQAAPLPAASGPSTGVAPAAAAPSPAPAPAATASSAEPAGFTVQAGAFARREDAEAQRSKLAMLGYESRLMEREQGGKVIFRVRCGPFEKKEGAEELRAKLEAAGIAAAVMPPNR